MHQIIKHYSLYIAWFTALVGTISSLIGSEVFHIVPCVLCWYQRILLYPLVIIIAVGILRKDKKMYQYVLPFTIPGMAIAFYHHLLQVKVIPETMAPCVQGISCATVNFLWFGFITFPLLSFFTFAIITVTMYLYKRYH